MKKDDDDDDDHSTVIGVERIKKMEKSMLQVSRKIRK